MSIPLQRGDTGFFANLSELCLELSRINLGRPKILGDQIVQAVSSHLGTDRVSLLFASPTGQGFAKVFTVGFEPGSVDWDTTGKVVQRVKETKEPLLVYDIREQPDLVGSRLGSYRTDGFAVFPLISGRLVKAYLCLSNLSSQQIMQLENSVELMQQVISQINQYSQLISTAPSAPARRQSDREDELGLLGSLIENLDQSLDARNIFTIFYEVVSKYIPVDMLAVIHDGCDKPHCGVVSVHRPVHLKEVTSVFDDLAGQWQRRHRRSVALEIKDVAFKGRDLVCEDGECPPELALEGTEVFPILIDNDLFGLVCLSTTKEAIADKRAMQMFNILAHHLLVHLKKSLLLIQNQEMQTVDSLTGLYNERQFYQMMDREFDRVSRYNVPISILFVDVDHFKDVNETYGFETGDILLKEISLILMENMRNTDFCSRYSGERFVIVLPETHYKNSEIMANRLRRYIENHSFFVPNTNVFIKVTVSIGVASYLDHKPASLAQFIEFADTALYFAKRNGRNQVVGYSYVINLMISDTNHES